MTERPLDIVGVGTCYVDTNVENFPFDRHNMAGEELLGEAYDVVPGGSAVSFCSLSSQLGLKAAFIGMAGNDPNSHILESLLKDQGVEPLIIRRDNVLTNISFNIANPQGDHLLFVAGTANAALSPADVLPKLEKTLPKAKMLYLGGCLKLEAFKEAYRDIAELARVHDTTIIVDHGRVPETVSQGLLDAVRELVMRATYYFPSREELCTVWNVSNLEEGLRKLHAQAPGVTTVAKDGENGAFYMQGNAIQHVTAQKVAKNINPTGAGDSFNAGVITAISKGCALEDAVAYGCKVAAAKITATDLPTIGA